tara:strand:- start:180 stop:806 length:627 start_codon:yes stop_codon:yes gene_type:complete
VNKQKIISYQFKDNINELNFFVNETNCNAFNRLINQESTLSFLYGPKKSGKSFLADIWKNKYNANKLSNNFEELIKKNDNILVDDFHTFDQEIIFHLVNYCILNNLKILITSSYKINDINFKFYDLPSRLKTFSNLEIYNPDDEMLLTILTKLLVDKQFIVNSNDIFDYILRRVDRSYKGIYDIVDKLDVLSLEKKRQLTIPLIKEIL